MSEEVASETIGHRQSVVAAVAEAGVLDRDADSASGAEHEPVAGSRLPIVTVHQSGIRSPSESGSVQAEPAPSGPAGSHFITTRAPAGSMAVSSPAGALHQLVVDVGDAAIVERFIADYLRLLDQRITGLEGLLSGTDIEATAVSLLTLESSSAMLGGQDVVASARALRRAVEHRDSTSIPGLFDKLRSTLTALQEQLPAVELRPVPAGHPAVDGRADSRRP